MARNRIVKEAESELTNKLVKQIIRVKGVSVKEAWKIYNQKMMSSEMRYLSSNKK